MFIGCSEIYIHMVVEQIDGNKAEAYYENNMIYG